MVRPNFQLWSGVLPDKWCDDIIEETEENYSVQKASTFTGDEDNHRRSKVRWISSDMYMRDTLFNFVIMAAKEFNIQVFRQADIQYTEYHSSEKGHYNWHHDIDWNRNDNFDRKISVTLQLTDPSEYEGGEFSFLETQNPVSEQMKARGSILCFPSYLQHQVSPVTKGVRKSVVAWFEGPTWR